MYLISIQHGRRAARIVSAALLLAAGAAAAADYPSTVLSDNPRAYYRLNDPTARTPINKNSGSLGAAGNATNDLAGIVRPFPGALVGDGNRSEFFDFSSRTEVPWNAAVNPPNTQPFTVEAWFYPASDQTATGQCPIGNRYAPPGANRQGWVFFQRKPSADYNGTEPVGWNFRMYNENGGSGALDVTSLVPYQVGKWTHVVVVYDPVNLTNATVTMYIDGVSANTNIWTGGGSGTAPGYVANSNNHPDDPSFLAIGNYNNTAGAVLNPFFGGVDEFALYSSKLTPAQILAHYQNGTNANRATPYATLIQSANPVLYLRLDEIAPGPDVALNMGDLRAGGVATHTAEVRHPAPSALAGRTDDGAVAYHNRNGRSTTSIPWRAENNPDAGVPFTFEAWLRPMRDAQGGQCPVNNRYVSSGKRTGWVIFQRNPNLTYPASEGHGYNFRMFDGVGSGGQDILTGTDYKIGEWSHLVVTWEPQTDNGDPAGVGNHQFQGILTGYFNGVPVVTNASILYAANTNPTENATPAADLAIGSYNAASTLGNNPFEGDIDEVAIYNNYALKAEQVLAHYQAGTNAHPATNYETLVLTAPFTGPERQGPKTYLRFNDPAYFPAANSGTLGYLADGNLVLTTNIAAGPRSPAFLGFDASNNALPLDGLKQWASFNNPAGLNFAGQITLEAWVKSDATQFDPARIISHGPQTLSDFLATAPDNAITNSSETFVRIDGSSSYVSGSAAFTNNLGTSFYYVNAPFPPSDLGGGNWVHLVSTYDGAKWNSYRNGILTASTATDLGALLVNGGDWAIGAKGNGWADPFAGSVDEVAIYSYALSGSRIAAHYSMAVLGPNPLTIVRSGANVILTWPAGTLQQATSITGPFSDVVASSPLTTPITGSQHYYRIRL
jgi:hypothetical protein